MANIIQLPLSKDEYFQEPCKKTLIVLHHTVGGTAQSSINYWEHDPRRVATAFVVERDGTTYQAFPAQHWAYHIGLGNKALEQRSIGIEIASEGGLTEKDGALYKFGVVSPRTLYTGPVYDHGSAWRGFRYFAEYTPQQVHAAIALALMLCADFKIDRNPTTDPLTYDPQAIHFHGITTHAALRKDKSDLHPGFPWRKLQLEVTNG
jgi:N-acetyl-anhydromuramyl-L-alanine amidase AmpD